MKIAPLDLVIILIYLVGITCIGILVGLAAALASVGIVMGNFEWMASFCLIALALFFAPS